MPMPDGGLVASFRQKVFGISALGQLLWTLDAPGWVLDWVPLGEQLLVSAVGEDAFIWEVDETGLTMATIPVAGQLLIQDEQLVVYGENGLHGAVPGTPLADLLCALPRRRLEEGDLIALGDGGFLLMHADSFDKRLLVLNTDGTVRWQRSLVRTLRGYEHHMLMVDGYSLLVSHRRVASSSELLVSGIDLERGLLVRLFATEGWAPRPGEGWAYPIGHGYILLNIGSGAGLGRLVALDIQMALEVAVRVKAAP